MEFLTIFALFIVVTNEFLSATYISLIYIYIFFYSCNTSEDEEDEKKDSDYEEEEWDRHRALHNDVSARRMVDNVDDLADQPGTKERLFEDKMEVTWDKGSSGLVFYTDAQYWKEVENHEEAEDADDWDVDTSEYDNPGTG